MTDAMKNTVSTNELDTAANKYNVDTTLRTVKQHHIDKEQPWHHRDGGGIVL